MVKRINDVVLRRVQKENAAEQFTVIMADVRNKVFIPESFALLFGFHFAPVD